MKKAPSEVADDPSIVRISSSVLNSLMNTLEVRFVTLSKCLVSCGYQMELGGVDAPGIHYNLAGTGRVFIGDNPPIDIVPHTLIIVPTNCPFRIEAIGDAETPQALHLIDGRLQTTMDGMVRRFVAGDGKPEIILICGYFYAFYGVTTALFETLTSPIVEQFSTSDQLDQKLKSALTELVSEEIGCGAMSSALLKQVIIALLRRSLNSTQTWAERFALLRDPQISQAFSVMAARPGAPHTVQSLAQSAYLSRSAFMARFTEVVGRPPMIVLRDLRMRQAAQQLKANSLSVDQIAEGAGYESRSSFLRAFRKVYGSDPSDYRAAFKTSSQNPSPLPEPDENL